MTGATCVGHFPTGLARGWLCYNVRMKGKAQGTKFVTKKDLDTALEHHLEHYQKVILGAMSEYAEKNEKEHAELRKSLNHLFVILKAEVAMTKRIFKEKLGVEISLQGR